MNHSKIVVVYEKFPPKGKLWRQISTKFQIETTKLAIPEKYQIYYRGLKDAQKFYFAKLVLLNTEG